MLLINCWSRGTLETGPLCYSCNRLSCATESPHRDFCCRRELSSPRCAQSVRVEGKTLGHGYQRHHLTFVSLNGVLECIASAPHNKQLIHDSISCGFSQISPHVVDRSLFVWKLEPRRAIAHLIVDRSENSCQLTGHIGEHHQTAHPCVFLVPSVWSRRSS